ESLPSARRTPEISCKARLKDDGAAVNVSAAPPARSPSGFVSCISLFARVTPIVAPTSAPVYRHRDRNTQWYGHAPYRSGIVLPLTHRVVDRRLEVGFRVPLGLPDQP